jgi:NDP-sugar pyrophosphorylase family protein
MSSSALTLIIMAAGLGSRFGSLKQLASFGPHGQRIIDYSIYDAVRAGFDRILFIIRKETLKEFSDLIIRPWSSHITCDTAFQNIDDIPASYANFAINRKKPWGTAHAIYAARNHIDAPFGVINADDFYGYHTFDLLAQNLRSIAHARNTAIMIPFTLRKTLSAHGSVSRGICSIHPDRTLAKIQEFSHIHTNESGIITGIDPEGRTRPLLPDSPTSMNVWGFNPDLFPMIEASLNRFLETLNPNSTATPEFGLPNLITDHISENNLTVHTYTSPSQWFGVTHPEDRSFVQTELATLTKLGIYPAHLY